MSETSSVDIYWIISMSVCYRSISSLRTLFIDRFNHYEHFSMTFFCLHVHTDKSNFTWKFAWNTFWSNKIRKKKLWTQTLKWKRFDFTSAPLLTFSDTSVMCAISHFDDNTFLFFREYCTQIQLVINIKCYRIASYIRDMKHSLRKRKRNKMMLKQNMIMYHLLTTTICIYKMRWQ